MVGLDPVFELDVTVLDEGCERYCLEHGTWLCRPSCRHIEHFSEFSLLVLLQVDHSSDGACLDFHHHYATSYDVIFHCDVLPECLVGDVLDVDVEGGPDVASVSHVHDTAVHIRDHSLGVCHLLPFETFLAVKDVVVLSFDAYVSCIGVIVVLYVADDSSCKSLIRVLAGLLLFDDHSAGILALAEKRELLELLQCPVVDVLRDGYISFLEPSSCEDEVLVVGCVLSFLAQHSWECVCELFCLGNPIFLPFLSFLLVPAVLFLEDVAVHMDLVHRC